MKFNKIVKKWAHAINLYKKDKKVEYLKYCIDNDLEIGEFSRCVVGEAHDWRSAYYRGEELEACYECESISYGFNNAFRGDYPILGKFEKVKEKFERHWCEVHSPKVKK